MTTIPCDHANPAQVWAVLGIAELASMSGLETEILFADGTAELADGALAQAWGWLSECTVALGTGDYRRRPDLEEKWGVPGTPMGWPQPDSTSTVVVSRGDDTVVIDWWCDGLDRSQEERSPYRWWAGQRGLPAAAILARLLDLVRAHGPAPLDDPLGWCVPNNAAHLRIDPRGVTSPIDDGFAPRTHGMLLARYPLCEVLAAIGLQYTRPSPRIVDGEPEIRYHVPTDRLPLAMHRAAHGTGCVPSDEYVVRFVWYAGGRQRRIASVSRVRVAQIRASQRSQ